MDLAGVAVVDQVGPVERRMPRDQVVTRDVRGHRPRTAERTRRELRVVKRVVEHGPEFDHLGLPDREALAHADVKVVDAAQRQRVSPAVRMDAGSGLDIARVRVIGQISD